MQKKGQVAIFVIIGIIIVILVALMFIGRKEYGIGISGAKFLSDKLDSVKQNVDECVNKLTSSSIKQFAEQGGDFNPSRYVLYQNRKVKYLCYNIEDDYKCINMLPPFEVMIKNLQERADRDMKGCIDKEIPKSKVGAYDSKVEDPVTEINVDGTDVVINVDYHVELSKDGATVELGKITRSINAPLYELYRATYDVVNDNAGTGFFDQLIYMLNKKGKIIINVDKSPSTGNGGDIIYKINKKDDNFEFWFAIEGD